MASVTSTWARESIPVAGAGVAAPAGAVTAADDAERDNRSAGASLTPLTSSAFGTSNSGGASGRQPRKDLIDLNHAARDGDAAGHVRGHDFACGVHVCGDFDDAEIVVEDVHAVGVHGHVDRAPRRKYVARAGRRQHVAVIVMNGELLDGGARAVETEIRAERRVGHTGCRDVKSAVRDANRTGH